ncbi:MAG: hypothetical protein KDA46_13290 [Parvularculaceae bacterium]|nr:hypothetical protein [Parvularculaceae bacterium]
MTSAAIVSLRVAASPERAFDAFTRDIDAWWRAGLSSMAEQISDGAGELADP